MSTHDDDPEPPTGGPDTTARFRGLWSAHAPRVHAYAMRHVDPDTAQEVVAETFLVAWRRLGEVPAEALPWLIVVARNTIANARRSHRRQRVLHDELTRLEQVSPAPGTGADDLAVERATMLRGLAALSPADREMLLLVSWDGLTSAQAAAVHGVTVPTFQVRLHRARRRLARLVDPPAGEEPATVRTLAVTPDDRRYDLPRRAL